MQHCFSLLRSIFVGYGPSRTFGRGTKFFPQAHIVELQYHAIGFVGKLPALFIPIFNKLADILQFVTQPVVGTGKEAELLKLPESHELGGIFPIITFEVVGDKTHVAAGYLSGILQFERSCRCIAGIGKSVFLRTAVIELFKIFLAHKNFATHLNLALFTLREKAPEIRQTQGYGWNCFNICCNIVTLKAVASCGSTNQ